RPSTQEAVYGRAHIRCCDSEACIIYAMKMAVDGENLIKKSFDEAAQHNFI
ncbi:MAG: hypothetical protein G01um101429_371, partial [Parcubacteria group bacterium Gr01-1014_29]